MEISNQGRISSTTLDGDLRVEARVERCAMTLQMATMDTEGQCITSRSVQ